MLQGRIKRRLVCGLRECHKQIGLRDAKCLIVATNIERIPIEGGLDDQIGALCAACREQELPVIFALSKNKLGRVVKKACVSCVAVLNFQGADNQYKTMLEELRKCKEMEQKAEQTTLSEDAPDAEFLDQGIAAISLVPQEDDEEEDDEEEVEDEEETEESSLNRDDPSQQMIASSVAPINPPLYSPYYVDASQFSHYPTAPYIYPYQRPVPYMGSDGAMYFLPYQQYGRPDGYSYLPHPPLPPPPPPYGVSSYPPYDSQPHNAQM
uniref:Ribosomal protein L7Ae/L30e/S12e/Gadd45 domain-containing protein n=1 Tax=Plectus sambesii TaxID=2011161 RepID=A0A914W6L4_9BILA